MKRAALLWALPALAACAAFAALGTWQLQRAELKQRLLAAWSDALAAPARDYASAVGPSIVLPRREEIADNWSAAALPLRVEVSGHWDPGTTVLLDNQRLGAEVGAMVFTRFVPDPHATPLLINRGWVALTAGRGIPTLALPSVRHVTLSGLLVAPPATGVRLGPFDWMPGQPPALLAWLDFDAIGGARGPLFRGVLQLDPAQPDGFTRQWQALPNTLSPEKHRGYAVQWFGLSLAVVAVYFILALRRQP